MLIEYRMIQDCQLTVIKKDQKIGHHVIQSTVILSTDISRVVSPTVFVVVNSHQMSIIKMHLQHLSTQPNTHTHTHTRTYQTNHTHYTTYSLQI